MKKMIFTAAFSALSLLTWGVYAQNIYFQTPTAEEACEREWKEENPEQKECEECESREVCQPRRHHWKDDYFEEEQFQDGGWPSRRDDELSDQLGREVLL